MSQNGPQKRVLRRKLGLETVSSGSEFFVSSAHYHPHGVLNSVHKLTVTYYGEITIEPILNLEFDVDHDFEVKNGCFQSLFPRFRVIPPTPLGGRRTVTISRVKFPWPPFFRIFIFFDEVFNSVRGTTYLMRDDGATVVNVRSSRVIWSPINPTDVLAQPRRP